MARLIPYADITSVNLRFRPQRSGADSYVCRVQARGVAALEIRSVSWRNPIWRQNRADTYRPFLLALHDRIAGRQPPPRFVAGDPPWSFALQIALWILPIPVIFVAMHDADWPTRVMYTLLPIFPLGFVALFYWYRRLRPNQPRPYDPRALPRELLPEIKGITS
ncbi:MAG TPA: hypothetical protein VJ890_02330 [Vineibacter sp.]|nr:hypothetical protein [Vineibacter sp.]